MQARTMALLEFACPPLPIANGQRIESNEPVIINSHDLLSTFMVQARSLPRKLETFLG